MNRMVASQDWGKVRAEFPDLGIADVGVEDLLKHSQLLGTDELLVVEKATVLNDGALQHVLDLVLDLGSDVSRFHSNITSICLHWKRFPVNLSVFSGSKVRVELPGTGLGGVSVWPSAGYCGPRGEGGVNASGTELSAELREKRDWTSGAGHGLGNGLQTGAVDACGGVHAWGSWRGVLRAALLKCLRLR